MPFKTIRLATICAAMMTGTTALLALPAAAEEYVIDTKGMHASIEFRIKHLGFSWLAGRFNTFSGDFTYDAKAPEA